MPSVTHCLLTNTAGTSHQLTSHHFGQGSDGKKIYIQAALHADEIPSMLVALVLKDALQKLDEAGRLHAEVVLVVSANPLGLGQYIMNYPVGRFELASGQNFNRSYPLLTKQIVAAVEGRLVDDIDRNRTTIRQAWHAALLALQPRQVFDDLQRTLMLLSHDADIMLDLHCSKEAAVHVYTGEAIWPEVEPLARYLGACASLLAIDSGSQSFDEAHSYTWWQLKERLGQRFPIPDGSIAVTVEHRGQRDVSDEYAQQDATAILNYLTHYGAIDGEVAPLPALPYPATPLAGSEQFYAPVSGILLHRAELGTAIHRGQPMFDIVDIENGARTTICSNTDGVFYMRKDVRFVRQGDPLGRVSGSRVLRTGPLLSA